MTFIPMNELSMVVTYWGGSLFDRSRFKPIENGWKDIKPKGGLWTSPKGGEDTWEDWCRYEDFRLERLEKSFDLQYKGKTIIVDSESDLGKLLWIQEGELYPGRTRWSIDFQGMRDLGADAIWLTADGQWATRNTHPRNLYGWDCNTVLVMNPDSVEQIYIDDDELTHRIIDIHDRVRWSTTNE